MILIADSGSSKTDWRLLSPDGSVEQAKTVGFNPYFQDADMIYEELVKALLPQLSSTAISEIYYYGAGCSTDTTRGVVHTAVKKAFPSAQIDVNHDLLAAARALCGHEPGIACILGTGVNSCLVSGWVMKAVEAIWEKP
jgi:N-acetylglucosamine kinase-like BadF-type ATPase